MFRIQYVVNTWQPDLSDLPAWFASEEGQAANPITVFTPNIHDALIASAVAIQKHDYGIGSDGSFGSIHLIVEWVEAEDDQYDGYAPYLHFVWYTEIGISQ